MSGLSHRDVQRFVENSLENRRIRRVLLIPPDFTRLHSCGGVICAIYYELLLQRGAEVDVMPALGTHEPMTREQIEVFFGGIVPCEKVIVHNWRNDVVRLGFVPGEYVEKVSEGIMSEPIPVEVNRRIVSGDYDLIVSIGQVVPHEVVGMANYSKNIFVGCGGSAMISASHMLGAAYGMERIMGHADTPVRAIFDYAEEHFISHLPIIYALTVTTRSERGSFDGVSLEGLFIGRGRDLFVQAAELSQKLNFIRTGRPPKTVVCRLDELEFHSTWLGNKAVYRTRLAIADGGKLIVLAPGVRRFGEDNECDRIIRKYGYTGRERILALSKSEPDLRENLSAAAHLIHGSSDGRFEIAYAAPLLSREEVEGVGYTWLDFDETINKYNPETLQEGWNTINGEEIYYIDNPALGLWSV
ncbi:MAG: lactate racemase domain-containing protein [Eubacteriales bacterium]|jgi:nickel-dependent lactate racemase|nr:DUF2088 domain-containing protein [Clostridiales bacterium]